MRIALFLGFLAVAICYAAWRGGGPERVMAGIAAAMVGLDQLLHAFVPPNFLSIDSGHLAIDLFGAAASWRGCAGVVAPLGRASASR